MQTEKMPAVTAQEQGWMVGQVAAATAGAGKQGSTKVKKELEWAAMEREDL